MYVVVPMITDLTKRHNIHCLRKLLFGEVVDLQHALQESALSHFDYIFIIQAFSVALRS